VGGSITPLLEQEGLRHLVIERDRLTFERLRERGTVALYGDASSAEILRSAGIESAKLLIIASPDGFQARRILELARRANPQIDTIVRTHSEDEFGYLQRASAGLVVMGERELARRMSEHALQCMGVPAARAHLLAQGESPDALVRRAERL
jgi:CPA2 family monovalent cation:H+ antiporter-2